jgi:hypothetical protein
LISIHVSAIETVAKAQQEAHVPCYLAGVIFPIGVQSNDIEVSSLRFSVKIGGLSSLFPGY